MHGYFDVYPDRFSHICIKLVKNSSDAKNAWRGHYELLSSHRIGMSPVTCPLLSGIVIMTPVILYR